MLEIWSVGTVGIESSDVNVTPTCWHRSLRQRPTVVMFRVHPSLDDLIDSNNSEKSRLLCRWLISAKISPNCCCISSFTFTSSQKRKMKNMLSTWRGRNLWWSTLGACNSHGDCMAWLSIVPPIILKLEAFNEPWIDLKWHSQDIIANAPEPPSEWVTCPLRLDSLWRSQKPVQSQQVGASIQARIGSYGWNLQIWISTLTTS